MSHPVTGFDPRRYGCKCDVCPLGPNGVLRVGNDEAGEWRPVGPEWRKTSRTLIVGEVPADTESDTGYPLTGASGIALHGMLTDAGQQRRDFSLTNVIACQPPGQASGAYERMDARLRRMNNARRKKGLSPIDHPTECCRPRLLKEMSQVDNVVILGTTALRAVTGKKINITSKRGSIFETDLGEGVGVKKCGATFHPEYVNHAPGERPTVVSDFGKFHRYFSGNLRWHEPGILFCPTVEETSQFLEAIPEHARLDTYTSLPESFCDTETNAKEPLVANLRCISAGYVPRDGLVIATCWACQGSGVAGVTNKSWPAEAQAHLRAYLRERRLIADEGTCGVCKGVGSYETDFVCVISVFESVGKAGSQEPPITWYSPEDLSRLETVWARYLTRNDIWKIGHNFSGYDRQALEKSPFRTKTWIGVTPQRVKDSLADAHSVAPDASKSLASVGSRFTDVTTWKEDYKGDKIAVGSTNDFGLGVYCCYDIGVNAHSFYAMLPIVVRAGAHNRVEIIDDILKPHTDGRFGDFLTQYDIDHRAQYMAVGMHKVGLCVDEERRSLYETLLRTQGQYHLAQFLGMAERYGVKMSAEEAAKVEFEFEDDGVEGFDGETAGEADADDNFNPRSGDQIRVLLYDKIGLGIPESLEKESEFLTKTGQPAVNDTVLRAIIADRNTPKDVALGLRHFRLYKRKDGKMASLLKKFGQPRVGSDGKELGHLWSDGAVRSSFGAFLVATKRYNSANPNMANLGSRKGSIVQSILEGDTVYQKLKTEQPFTPAEMRRLMKLHIDDAVSGVTDDYGNVVSAVMKAKLKSIFRAKPGFLLCGGDMDQLHLRIIANLFKIPVLLQAFKEGLDPHCYMAYVAFGDKFKNADGWGPEGFSLKRKPKGGTAFAMREGAKTLRYLLIYGGSADTAWRSYISVEGETGDLPYAKTSRDEVRRIRRAWMLAEPEWERTFWNVAQAEYEANGGFLLSPITNIRSGALEGGTRSAASNWKVLFFEALVARIAEHQMMLEFPFAVAEDGFVGVGPYAAYGTPDPSKIWDEGMCSQVHDFMAAQVKDRSGPAGLRRLEGGKYEDKWVDNLRERVKEALTVNIPGHDVVYSCDPGIAYSLDGV